MPELNLTILSKLRSPSSKQYPHRSTILGKVFGRLTAYGLVGHHIKDKTGYWLCRCVCGGWSVVNRNKLQRGYTKTCGCGSAVNRTHGMRRTRIYTLWTDMLTRCRNPNQRSYANYGGRSIRVCEGLQRFENFYALLGHPPKGHSTDRINNDGNYSCGKCNECATNDWPMNVRWLSSRGQNRNRRDNRLITIGGETKCLAEWMDSSEVEYATAWYRLHRGWTPEEAFGFKERNRISCLRR